MISLGLAAAGFALAHVSIILWGATSCAEVDQMLEKFDERIEPFRLPNRRYRIDDILRILDELEAEYNAARPWWWFQPKPTKDEGI